MNEQLEGLEYVLRESGAGCSFAPEDLSEEQRLLGKTAEQLAREEVMPVLGRIDEGDHALVAALLRRSGDLGLLGTEVPEEYGGLALDKATNVLIAEKLGHTGSFAVAFMAHTGIGTLPPTTQIILEGARFPPEALLGEAGQGHKIAFNVLNVGRFKLGAVCVGAAKGALGEGIRYAVLRKQFGVPIARFGAIREKIADCIAQTYASEAVAYRVAGLLDARLAAVDPAAPDASERTQAAVEEYAAECAIAKVFCSEVLADVADEVIQIHGGYGFTREYAAERYYRDERINRIFEGTNEINRLLVPTTLLRRTRGDVPGLVAADPAPGRVLAAERQAVTALKAAFLAALREAAGRFGARLKEEQEVLLALADLAIQIFAAESAILRAERRAGDAEARRTLHEAAARAVTFRAFEAGASAARRALCLAGAVVAPAEIVALQQSAGYLPRELRDGKRRLTDAACAVEAYPF